MIIHPPPPPLKPKQYHVYDFDSRVTERILSDHGQRLHTKECCRIRKASTHPWDCLVPGLFIAFMYNYVIYKRWELVYTY